VSIIEIYKPTFDHFHEKPTVTWQETKGPIRVAVNMFEQYMHWLRQWTDPHRNKWAPCPAFWESGGPAICRALSHFGCNALYFDYETDRKVGYRWITRAPDDRPGSHKTDWYRICHVRWEGNIHNGEGRVTVTTPYDEDVSFYFNASSMKLWLREKPEPETKS